MAGVRRALLFNACERYVGLAINFGTVSVTSRLLTPGEVGLSVIGLGIMTLALALREFVSPDFLIQRTAVSRPDVRTAFTVLLLLYGPVAVGLAVLAPRLAGFYGEPGLAGYIRVVVAAGLLETLSSPILALLRRDMAFGVIAALNTAVAAAGAAATVGLAALGFGFMSFAWAWLAAAATTSALALWYRPHWWMFVPSLASWRSAVGFGGCNGAVAALGRFYEALPQLVLGRILSADVVAFYNRAGMVVTLPDRLVLSGVFSVAFPAFAAAVRQGGDVKRAYLLALSHITVFHWPALLLLGVLAHPAVLILMGPQWAGIVPLVRIMSAACLFWFPVILTQPVLVALGAQRDNLVAKLVAIPVCAAVLCAASLQGLEAMALSQAITIPFQMAVALVAVRRHVGFAWSEVAGAVWRSAVVTALSLSGPLAVVVLHGFDLRLPIPGALLAVVLAALGWIAGLRLTRHPVFAELLLLAARGGRSGMGRRLARFPARRVPAR
ncbi:oligosaccharide flippase family protein [Azospirillum picis]|uniref:O-antigen/teichoic acid export membrane protein n=1 Tax=Azospirillum picis TaxID=488438 RepID=A0ABU0MRK7_9PROT|nr:oligosaccharide flippase family protein [Azospirillum picis]MBP2300845.1 O-antigen/teichoic acid export membrane protein [Azospirillum picis]MDQ0536102.1 O-antigen/teichoic acid export membrane protein [Azospirillum picis]